MVTPPHLIKASNVSTVPLNNYPLFSDNALHIYTDGSKTDFGTGCAFVIFLNLPRLSSTAKVNWEVKIVSLRQSCLLFEIV